MIHKFCSPLDMIEYMCGLKGVPGGTDPNLFKNHKAEGFRNNTGPDTWNIINMGGSLQD